MNLLTHEWIVKAEADLTTARREFRARKNPNYDAVCFHSQQAAEKFLKAVLQEKGYLIPRLHSLLELVAMILKFDSDYSFIIADLQIMEGYAVQFRYPGQTAEKEDARSALKAAENVTRVVRMKLMP